MPLKSTVVHSAASGPLAGKPASKKLSSAELVAALAGRVRGDVLADPLSLAMYSTDASIYQIPPSLVICPRDAADVQQAVRFAAEVGLPIVARGAGSGLAGETLTTGIVMDFSRYCSAIRNVDVKARTGEVEMGCVFQRLNQTLAPQKLLFGPDPSSGNRACMGGIIGNNATGAHSIRCGYAGDHVNWLDVVLADGTAARFHADGRVESGEASELRERIVQRIPQLLAEWTDIVKKNWPKTDRNRAGYAVKDTLLPGGKVNWAKLLAGSEGTLAVFTAAQVTLDPVPAVKVLTQLNFDSLLAMARALPAIVATGCSAAELMDGMLLEMARQANGGPHKNLPDVAASLVVEHDGATLEEVLPKLDHTIAVAKTQPGLVGEPARIVEKAEQAELWNVRKRAVPLLFRGRNGPQPVPFIEDVAVTAEGMAEYVGQLEKIVAGEGASVAYYAHAGHGELHIRPFLDLHNKADREKMVRIARKTFELAWRCGGTISGEHGCGLTRSGFLRQQYGQVYELFKLVKETFDPAGRLNPGKIVTDRSVEDLMTTQLRFDYSAQPERMNTILHWEQGEMVGELEACNGCGECRGVEEKLGMCPIFRARGGEEASPRAKANLMRLIVTGRLNEAMRGDPAFRAVADLCINCKSCHFECPSAVNIPKLMQEAKSFYVSQRGLRMVEAVLARGETMGLLGSRFGAVANVTLKVPGVRWGMEKAMGVDRRRPMPAFAFGSFVRKARAMASEAAARRGGKAPTARIAYFMDLFANYHDHALGQAVMDVLLHNDIEVIVPPQKSAAMPAIDYGSVAAARSVIEYNVRNLIPAIDQGYEVICSEPTAALCLKEEWQDLVHTPEVRKVAQNTRELMSFLLSLHKAGKLKTDFKPVNLRVGYHTPCHLKALKLGTPGAALVKLIPGMTVDVIERGCCGIAGTYGFQKRNYDLSLAAGRPMLDALRASPAEYGMSECATCKMQMDHVAGKFTFHPIKLLAMAYGYTVKGVPAAR